MTWPFGNLKTFGYDVIVADPPTKFELRSEKGNAKSASRHYDLMSWEDLARLPVGHLARANALLMLWSCAPTLKKSMWLMEQWGALYLTEMIWRKVTRNGKPRMGPGYRARTLHEPILLGVFGNETQIHDAFPSVFDGVAREHSRKPDEFYDLVLRKTLGLSRCDLFSRQTRPGFDGWGDEHGKFDIPCHPRSPQAPDEAPLDVDPDLLTAAAALEG